MDPACQYYPYITFPSFALIAFLNIPYSGCLSYRLNRCAEGNRKGGRPERRQQCHNQGHRHGLLSMSASASAIPKVNIWFRVIGRCEHTGELQVNNAVRAARARRNRYLGGYRSTTKVEMRSHESGRLGGTNLATANRMVYSARSTYGAKGMKRFPPPVRGVTWEVGEAFLSTDP